MGLDSSLGTSTHAKGEKKGFYLWAELCLVRCPTVMGRLAAPHFIQANFFPENWVQSAGGGPPAAGEQQSPSSAVGYNGGWGPFAICWVNPMEMEQRFWSSVAQQQKAKGCQVLCSQLCWLMLPSGGETPPKTSEVFVADLSESDLL